MSSEPPPMRSNWRWRWNWQWWQRRRTPREDEDDERPQEENRRERWVPNHRWARGGDQQPIYYCSPL